MNSDFLKGVIVGSAIFAGLVMLSHPFLVARAAAEMCAARSSEGGAA